MTAQDLKQYIYDKQVIDKILEEVGCTKIKFNDNQDGGFWSAARPNGDNPHGVIIKNCPYLNYYSYSQGINVDDGFDLITFVQNTRLKTFAETIRWLHDLFGLSYTFNKKVEEKPKYDPLAIFKRASSRKKAINVLDINIIDEDEMVDYTPGLIHIDIFREGIIKKSIEKFRLGYSYALKRTIYPIHYWMTGDLIGYTARTSIENYDLFDIPKYYISKGYNKTINLYGLWENYKSIEKAGYVVVVESEKCVVKRDSRNDSTCVAVSGHTISDEQVRILLGLTVNEIVICFDNDIPDEDIWSQCEKFYHIRRVSYIKDKWDILGEKESPADKPNKVYQFMFKNRIIYDENCHKKYLRKLEEK